MCPAKVNPFKHHTMHNDRKVILSRTALQNYMGSHNKSYVVLSDSEIYYV